VRSRQGRSGARQAVFGTEVDPDERRLHWSLALNVGHWPVAFVESGDWPVMDPLGAAPALPGLHPSTLFVPRLSSRHPWSAWSGGVLGRE